MLVSELKSIDTKRYPECEHMALVVKVINNYVKRFQNRLPYGLEFDDLVALSYITLQKCYAKFDSSKGSIKGYIARSICFTIIRAINQHKNPLGTAYSADKLNRIEDGIEELSTLDYDIGNDLFVVELLDNLSDRDKTIICMLHGIGMPQRDLKYVSKCTELWDGNTRSPQRVSQIHIGLLKKLKELAH